MKNDSPLVEVFGFPPTNNTPKAQRHRKNRLCPYNNKVPNCTKDKANDPLGVCSVRDTHGEIAITCPVRFRQDWLIAEHAAVFFFGEQAQWTALTEVRLNDADGVSAGNIDIVLVAYDDDGRLLDFGSLEIQAVYISGNVRQPFQMYMQDTENFLTGEWRKLKHRPRPDYLSSSRKRLVPQLLYKGAILKSWGKKQAVALHRNFYQTLPELIAVDPADADIVWLVYDLVYDAEQDTYHLQLIERVFTQFKPSLDQIITPNVGHVEDFVARLQDKLEEKLDDISSSPDVPSLDDLLRGDLL